MNKKELIDIVSRKQDLTKKDAEALVDTVFDTMVESILAGDKVLISGFGTFKVNNRHERTGVSPKTKELIVIPATKTIHFSHKDSFWIAADLKEED